MFIYNDSKKVVFIRGVLRKDQLIGVTWNSY